jgi:AraC-like DNA-binding protein
MGRNDEYFSTLGHTSTDIAPHTIFRVMDQYLCSYLFLTYVDDRRPLLLTVGPYLTRTMNQDEIIRHAKKMNLAPQLLENYYMGLPVLTNDSHVFSALYTFCEEIWGADKALQLKDLNLELTGDAQPADHTAPMSQKELATHKQMVELRYAYENELMNAVSRGITLKAELQHPSAFPSFLDSRSPDPVRNLKNYCIIMNTLLRKAAEQGGVHPIHLDELSRQFALKIEAFSMPAEGQKLMDEMFVAYCQLVKKFSHNNYSHLIQQTIIHIDANLDGDLRLEELAKKLNVNGSYLSSLFKKEMGQTLTDYITAKRMTLAMKLLGTTQMQIQMVAQSCGILDVNYFTKKFKKATGRTPKEYRQALETMLAKYTS